MGVLGQGCLPHPINKVMEDTNVTADSTARSHNGEHEDSATPPVHYTSHTLHTHHTSEHEVRATPCVHYTNTTLHTHHTSHTHYIPEIQAPQRPAGGSTKVPEGQQADPDAHAHLIHAPPLGERGHDTANTKQTPNSVRMFQ